MYVFKNTFSEKKHAMDHVIRASSRLYGVAVTRRSDALVTSDDAASGDV